MRRGRAYPLHPNLNQLGNDACRSMLRFAYGVPLGEAGVDQMFIQVSRAFVTKGIGVCLWGGGGALWGLVADVDHPWLVLI